MARRQDTPKPQAPGAPPSTRRNVDLIGLATLAGVVVLLVITYMNMRDIDRIDVGLGQRLGKIEGQIAQISSRAGQPPQQGPDPDRVYQISTANSPARGPSGAPITIAEFSDFQ